MKWLIFCFMICAQLTAEISKKTFLFTPEPIDVVIPCAPKDIVTLEMCINGIRQNGIDIRRIIVVSKTPLTYSAEWFDENQFPFTFRSIALEIFEGDIIKAERFLKSPETRVGWIFQQLLKLYAPIVIPGVSSNVLVLDSDVIFLNPTRFMNATGEPFFNTGQEHWKPYFRHAKRLLPDLRKVFPNVSGVCHHMLFQKPILDDLFALIRLQHNLEPWQALCRCIDKRELRVCCMSEYEIYFNFTFLRTDQAHLRPIKWVNLGSWDNMDYYQNEKFRYMACQEWLRKCHIATIDIHPGLPENENIP